MCGVIDLEEDFAAHLDVVEDNDVDLNDLPKEHFIKLLVLGDLGVGKTSLLKKYTAIEERPPPPGGGPSGPVANVNGGPAAGAVASSGFGVNVADFGAASLDSGERDKLDYR